MLAGGVVLAPGEVTAGDGATDAVPDEDVTHAGFLPHEQRHHDPVPLLGGKPHDEPHRDPRVERVRQTPHLVATG